MSAVLELEEHLLVGKVWVTNFPRLTRRAIVDFARNIGDDNPMHNDDNLAKKAGFQGIIAPGVMVMGFVSSAIAQKIPGVRVRRLEIEFRKPLYVGAYPRIACEVLQAKGVCAKIAIVVNDVQEELSDAVVTAKGTCTLIFPKKS